MLSELEKDIITIMAEMDADKGAMLGVISMLDEAADESQKEKYADKLLKYILAKGKYIKVEDIITKALQICTGCEHYMPPNMYVKYIGENTGMLMNGEFYQVLVSYNNDREFLIEHNDGEQEIYDAALFEKMDVCEIRYIGRENENGEIVTTDGFVLGHIYPVYQFKSGKYLCGNGLECWLDEGEPTKFEPARPVPILPFRTADGPLRLMRQAMEFGRHSSLENSLASACVYISQNADIEFHDSVSIMEHLRKVSDYQLEHNIFLDCALATVTESVAGNRFEPGQRCLPFYIDGNLEAIVFVTEENGLINGIYILNEAYKFDLDEP